MSGFTDALRQKRRIGILAAGLLILTGTLIARLFYLQVLQHQRFSVMASAAHTRKYEIPAKRGAIYLQDGTQKAPLGLNQGLKVLYADPGFVHDKVKTARELARITGDPENHFYELFQKPGDYVVLKRRVPLEIGERIAALGLPGIGITDKDYRVYPEGSLASQLLGFVNAEDKGQYGIEGFLDKQLAGRPGLLNGKTDVRGVPIATAQNTVVQPVNGSDVVLTIDRNIQAQAERFLKEGIESTRAKSGSVVVVDPSNGAIKAMANWPTYDPNGYHQVKDYSVFSNDVVQGLFEPGSGFKVVTMAAGLDTSKVKPETTYDDTGLVEVSGKQIRNAANHRFGRQNMVEVIQKSLNTGVIFVLKSLGGNPEKITLAGKKLLHEYISRFGFNRPTGIEQTGEARGLVNPPTSNDVNYANMTFGQGLSVTMIQMTMAVSAIANGGKLYQPYLVEQVIAADRTAKTTQPKVVNPKVMNPETAAQLTQMMIQVVEHGSGYAAKMKGYQVAGKTGTAQIPKSNSAGYEENRNIGTFVGFAPANAPKFVMMVRINEPQVQGFAESTTVPVFAKIADWLLRYMQVPPQG